MITKHFWKILFIFIGIIILGIIATIVSSYLDNNNSTVSDIFKNAVNFIAK